ncbi:MAG: HAMP domain-containing sensor histidine kinase, partial [Cyanobacteria bacterium P01_F01_bin.116]
STLKSRFVSMVCHEFRNPMNNIALSVSALNRYDEQLSLSQKNQYLLDIKENVERMTQMIDDILVLGKLEAKRLTLTPQPLNLVDFCRNLLSELPSAQGQLAFLGRHKPLIAKLDQTLLRSILTNILANAIRYTPDGKPVCLSLFRHRDQAVFVVKDSGLGIPPEDYPHLFEPFHRGKNVSNIPGTGLGLSIVKQFVDFQQGEIQVKSQLGEGTTFKVMLPLALTEE